MDGKVGWWVAIALSIPLSMIVNLLTPLARKALVQVSGAYKQRQADREARTRRYLGWLARNPHDHIVSLIADSSVLTSYRIFAAMMMTITYVMLGAALLVPDQTLARALLLTAGLFSLASVYYVIRTALIRRAFTRVVWEVRPQAVDDGTIWSQEEQAFVPLSPEFEESWFPHDREPARKKRLRDLVDFIRM